MSTCFIFIQDPPLPTAWVQKCIMFPHTRKNKYIYTYKFANIQIYMYIYMFYLGYWHFCLHWHSGKLGFLQDTLSTPIYKWWYFSCVPIYVFDTLTKPSEKVRNFVIICLEGVGNYHSLTLRWAVDMLIETAADNFWFILKWPPWCFGANYCWAITSWIGRGSIVRMMRHI